MPSEPVKSSLQRPNGRPPTLHYRVLDALLYESHASLARHPGGGVTLMVGPASRWLRANPRAVLDAVLRLRDLDRLVYLQVHPKYCLLKVRPPHVCTD